MSVLFFFFLVLVLPLFVIGDGATVFVSCFRAYAFVFATSSLILLLSSNVCFRWHHHPKFGIAKAPWTEREDWIVVELLSTLGNRRAAIAKLLQAK